MRAPTIQESIVNTRLHRFQIIKMVIGKEVIAERLMSLARDSFNQFIAVPFSGTTVSIGRLCAQLDQQNYTLQELERDYHSYRLPKTVLCPVDPEVITTFELLMSEKAKFVAEYRAKKAKEEEKKSEEVHDDYYVSDDNDS